MAKSGPSNFSHVELDGHEYNGSIRYFSWKEIEEMSSSRTDGIDLKKERSLQASYCRFLQELGMRLKVPQTTIAIAMVYCHRFFLQQSHAKNDRREAYEQQKALILLAERVVLVTLAFNFSVALPYRPLVEAIKKFNGAEKLFAQTAWNFVNDVLRTSLCLQYKPQHMAAGAFFLAAKFAKVKLPFEGEFWLQEFNITSQELEEITGQMMELYDVRRPLAIACEGSSGNRQ
ncbi:cyclin-T1-3-like isoform X2 [Phoenix dactylifera]|uniref:Cyclin-T1-3-like isoform X2 n=1 Tax=Phoenix dactylifera TaxID=42345 RepID=A0A8B8J9X9_PHODC|nr:cyclin-T1-3-like isoform X2 [Phoenix dactylifera]